MIALKTPKSMRALESYSMRILRTNHGIPYRVFMEWYGNCRRSIEAASSTKKETSNAYQRAYRQRNLEKHRERDRAHAAEYRKRLVADPVRLSKYREYCRNKMAEKLKNDPLCRIKFRMRNRIWMSLKRGVAVSGRTVDMIGCTIVEFKAHIESLWLPGMTWENYGRRGWHIDHIKPCKSFDLTDPIQQKACFHYTNTQPLWWLDNLSKGAKISPN